MEEDKDLTGPGRRSWLRWFLGLLCVLIVLPIVGAVALVTALTVQGEAPGFDKAAAQGIAYTPLKQIVPGPGLPADLEVMRSNNNLDVVRYGARWYLAFRTAPTHFASTKTRLVVLSSEDRSRWRKETEFQLMQSDLREPRFLVYKGKLFLYFFRGGSNPLEFAPQSIYATERTGDGTWTKPRAIFKPGYVVWRAKAHGGTAYMSVYYGAGIYTTKARAGEVRLLTSTDGYAWTPISDQPQVTEAGAEEAEFAFDDAGNLVATVRLEVQGALVCTASKDDLATWDRKFTPYKYDSALMFRHGEEFYVIARRNVAGAFNRRTVFLPMPLQRAWYLLRYSLTRKRTALYKVDVAAKRLTPLFDFPSKGDTAYAGIVPLDRHSYYVVNYSSPLGGPDWPWLGGQIAGSNLYECVLTFPGGRAD